MELSCGVKCSPVTNTFSYRRETFKQSQIRSRSWLNKNEIRARMFGSNRLKQPYVCILIIKVRCEVRVRLRNRNRDSEKFIKQMSAIWKCLLCDSQLAFLNTPAYCAQYAILLETSALVTCFFLHSLSFFLVSHP